MPNKADNNRGFTKYCSDYCKKHAPQVSESALSKLNDREWLYEHRITRRMSYADIGKLVGTSEIAPRRYCEIHQIPKVRYNESDLKVQEKLNDREWLYDQHIVQRKKCRDIADDIGSSSSTVSIFLREHNIQANKSNSYDRPNQGTSKECMEVIDFVRSIYSGTVLTNNRTVLNGSELDIYLPELGIAIEYNGIYSHLYRPHEESHALRKDKTYHIGKTIDCMNAGIQLIHIWSPQWKYKRPIVESILRSKLGLIEKRIYARKCIIQDVDTNTKNRFLDENHIQGKDRSKFKYGMFYNGELVALMTFTPSRYNKGYKWELSRFVVKKNTTVIGGFSKLLSYFRKNNDGAVISYADRCISDGNVYEHNGFKLIRTNPPSYWYVAKDLKFMEHRSKFTKKNIAESNDPRTEKEIMESLGYHRIWDCGTLAYAID